MLSQFQAIGQALFTQGLVSPQGGNLSVKLGERLVITHRGSALGYIQEGDLVETGINRNNRVTPLASTIVEIPVAACSINSPHRESRYFLPVVLHQEMSHSCQFRAATVPR